MKVEQVKKYYGFAVKSGSVVYGSDRIVKSKTVKLVLISSELSENSKKRLVRHAQTLGVPLFEFTEQEFHRFESNLAVKAVGIKQTELAKAMQL